MLLRVVSDLHLEFQYEYDFVDSLTPHMDTDLDSTLLLLGDIHVGIGAVPYLDEMSKRFKYVIYILGNHEFYYNSFYDLRNRLLDKTSYIPNLYLLENEMLILDDQKFVGCTLWTDIDKGREGSIVNVSNGLNDYHLIKSDHGRKLTTRETIEAHEYSIEYLKEHVDEDTIVLTHHAPIIGLSDPQFKRSPIGSGFESDLMDLIFEVRPKYWLYGHTHFNKGESHIDNTVLLSNQLGYPELGEKLNYNPTLILDI